MTATNHYNPTFQMPELRRRPQAYECVPAAYAAAELEAPARPTARILDVLAAKDKPRDVLDDLEARYINGADEPERLDELRRAWIDATFYDAVNVRLNSANPQRVSRVNEGAIQSALNRLAHEVETMAGGFADAAAKLDPAVPFDSLAAYERDAVAEMGASVDALKALGIIASLHDSPRYDGTADARVRALLPLLPILNLPEVGYAEPRSVEDVANGVGVEPRDGHESVVALMQAASVDRDVAPINVAQGRYPGVTIRLAQNPSILAQRIQRAIHATEARPYTHAEAQAHRQGRFTGAGQRIDDWAVYVLAHHGGVSPDLVTKERSVSIAARRR